MLRISQVSSPWNVVSASGLLVLPPRYVAVEQLANFDDVLLLQLLAQKVFVLLCECMIETKALSRELLCYGQHLALVSEDKESI